MGSSLHLPYLTLFYDAWENDCTSIIKTREIRVFLIEQPIVTTVNLSQYEEGNRNYLKSLLHVNVFMRVLIFLCKPTIILRDV